MKTLGHLANNGGVRGHSVGEFFPFIVVAKGAPDDLRWHVQSPNGNCTKEGYYNVSKAHNAARAYFKQWSAAHD